MWKSSFDYSWTNTPPTKEWGNKVPTQSPGWWRIWWTVDQVNEALENKKNNGKLIPPKK